MHSALYTDATMLSLDRLLDAVEEGAVAVPDFQRDFVWSENHVKSLLGTVFNGWPAGSILLTRGDITAFRTRPLEGAPPLRDVRFVVLDGQQRVTALYIALRGAGPTVYALDFSNCDVDVIDEVNIEESLRVYKREHWDRHLGTPRLQLAGRVMPLSALETPSAYFEWRDSVLVHLADDDNEDDLRSVLGGLYRERLSTVHRYQLPTVYLDSELSVAAIARIFEKVNRSGLQLGTFDLMVARLYEPGWNLREQWEIACTEYPRIDRFLGDDGMPVLQAISLKMSLDVRQQAVLEMGAEVRREWPRAIEALNAAIEFLTDEVGVAGREGLPYPAQLLCLAAICMHERGADILHRSGNAWFWRSTFGLRFDVAANTRVVSDYQMLLRRKKLPDATVSREALLSAARRGQRSLWAGVLCALSVTSAGDVCGLRDGGTEGHEVSRFVVTSLAHKGAKTRYGETPTHLRALSLVYASRQTAALIRRLGLAGAVAYASDIVSPRVLDRHLRSQWLPPSHVILDEELTDSQLLEWRLDGLVTVLSASGIEVIDEDLNE